MHAVGKGDPQVFAGQAGEPKFKVGDKVVVRELPVLLYTRTQEYVRGATGEIAVVSYESPAAEDETWDGPDQKPEWFYIVRFNLSELWHSYTGPGKDTLQTEIPERWLGRGLTREPGRRLTASERTHHDRPRPRPRTTAAPMVDEITDFEVLEIALRELCIEKGIFTAEEHRHFTEFAEQIGPTPAAHLVARAWIDPEFKKLVLTDPHDRQQRSRRRLAAAHRLRDTK